MRGCIACVVLLCYSATLCAQDRLPARVLVGQSNLQTPRVAVCGVDVVCLPPPDPPVAPPSSPMDLSPVWLAIQAVAARQAATDARLDGVIAQLTPLTSTVPQVEIRLGALEARVTVLDQATPTGSPSASFFAALVQVFTNPAVLAGIGALVGRYLVPAK